MVTRWYLSVLFTGFIIAVVVPSAQAQSCKDMGINPSGDNKIRDAEVNVPAGYSGTVIVNFDLSNAAKAAIAIENVNSKHGYWQTTCTRGVNTPFQVSISSEAQERPLIIHLTSFPTINDPGHGPCHPGMDEKPSIAYAPPGQPVRGSISLGVICPIPGGSPSGARSSPVDVLHVATLKVDLAPSH
jgi:hypothetical protein